MKPLVISQPLRKFDMFTFVVSHIVCSILFFSVNEGNQSLGFLTGKSKGGNFSKGDRNRMKLWYRCEEVQIKCFIQPIK